ncbi:DUF3368 domain-containing protein [Singulisphaera sp. GP187]|uniref:DUF3368 domain-containing protein n=1 Tax=Singulisphaera sp. GP187 TaxID=1882752 RepID=UPI001356573C|nr:DUF3368 domain-containing protein [Singulisphaera sp. GP187]
MSDTSPIRALANLQRLDLLPELFVEVVVPPAVERELRNSPKGLATVDLGEYPFIRVQAVTDRTAVTRFLLKLDEGESEALALALEVGADLILLDEAADRHAAKRAGLTPLGVLGVLLEAKQRRLIESLSPLLDQLQDDYRFFITPRLRAEVLRSAGEFPLS